MGLVLLLPANLSVVNCAIFEVFGENLFRSVMDLLQKMVCLCRCTCIDVSHHKNAVSHLLNCRVGGGTQRTKLPRLLLIAIIMIYSPVVKL